MYYQVTSGDGKSTVYINKYAAQHLGPIPFSVADEAQLCHWRPGSPRRPRAGRRRCTPGRSRRNRDQKGQESTQHGGEGLGRGDGRGRPELSARIRAERLDESFFSEGECDQPFVRKFFRRRRRRQPHPVEIRDSRTRREQRFREVPGRDIGEAATAHGGL